MKYIDWVINREELKLYSLEKFDQEDGSIYGFIALNIGEFTIGFIEGADGTSEGDEDISFYVNQLINCGIALQRNDVFSVRLLNSNLIEIRVHLDESVIVEVCDIQNDIIEFACELSLDEFISEIESAYLKFINDIKDINESILKSKLIRNTSALYESFLKMLDC